MVHDGKDFERSGRGLLEVMRKTRKTSVKKTGLPVEIRTENLSNTRLEGYH
jgi:hypothetical protein